MSNVDRTLQCRLFRAALDALRMPDDLLNRVLEIGVEGDEVVLDFAIFRAACPPKHPLPSGRAFVCRAWTGTMKDRIVNQTTDQTDEPDVKEIGAFEAKTKLGQLLDWVEAGEEVIITRRGKAVARLVSPDAAGVDRERARNAARGLRAMRKGVTLGGLKIKDLISEGRL